jgi:HSP20 family protein
MALSLRGTYDPFDDLRRMQHEMNRVFEQSLLGPVGGGTMTKAGDITGSLWSPRCDVKETDNEYLIHAELPGVKKEDLKYVTYMVTILFHALIIAYLAGFGRRFEFFFSIFRIEFDRGLLTLSGEKSQEKKQEGEKYYRVERSYGKFTRSFPVGEQVDTSQVKAQFNNGVLEVCIPKPQQQSAPKKITVS